MRNSEMENRKPSVRLLMQKERERRERLRHQAAALAACSVYQQQQHTKKSVEAASSAAKEELSKDFFDQTTGTNGPALSGEQALAKDGLPQDFFDRTAGADDTSSTEEPQPSAKEELPPEFVGQAVGTNDAAAPKGPQPLATGCAASGAAGDAERDGTRAGADAEGGGTLAAERQEEVVLDGEEEGVVFEIEEPDASLLLPMPADSHGDDATVEFGPIGDGSERRRRDIANSGRAGALPESAGNTIEGASDANAAAAEAAAERKSEIAERPDAASGTRRRATAIEKSTTDVPPSPAPLATPSPVTATLLASATGDELRWYRPFDTVFHSELLHEEEELAELQREAQMAAEKRATAAREAASAAAAAAVAAAAAAAGNAGAGKTDKRAAFSSMTKQQLAKKRAAAEATAAAAAAAEAAAAAAAAAAEKRAAAGEALLGKARAEVVTRGTQPTGIITKDGAVPWGFFDDEEREAAARGLTGPKRLQELAMASLICDDSPGVDCYQENATDPPVRNRLPHYQERRRDMAEDLQERKEDWLRHREDVRRFVHGVEEQVQDTSAYRLRVERLRQKRKAAAAGLEGRGSPDEALREDASDVGVTAGRATALADEPHAGRGAADTPESYTGTAVARRIWVKGEVRREMDVKEEASPANGSQDISRPTRANRDTGHARYSDDAAETNSAGLRSHEAVPSRSAESLSNHAVERVRAKHERLRPRVAEASTAKQEDLRTIRERMQRAEEESEATAVNTALPVEDDDESPDEDADVFPGNNEDDDSEWRTKSLLTSPPRFDVLRAGM